MQLNELLAQIDSLKAEIDKLRPLKPEVEHRIMQKFRLDWNYHSNAIEGNSLTLGETRAFLLEGLTANGKPLKDHLDIKGHDELISFLQLYIQRKETLTEADIREMHRILLKEPYEINAVTSDGRIVKRQVQLGVYKSEPNGVQMASGEFHQYTQPVDVPVKMAELVEWYRKQEEAKDLHPAIFAALFHHRFVAIHPFDDGNGRMARILMNLILMRFGFPPAVIKLQDREPYVSALRRGDVNEFDAISTFIAQCLIDSMSLYIKGAKGESIEEFDDVDKAIALFKQELAHVDVTLPLSQDLQKKSFESSVYPLLTAIESKLKQFDDLFSHSSTEITTTFFGEAKTVRTSDGRNVWVTGEPTTIKGNSLRGHCVDNIKKVTEGKSTMANQITITFSWLRFTKAGLNAFNFAFTLAIKFEELQLVVASSASKTPITSKRYPHQLSAEEIKNCASGLAKLALDSIRQLVGRSKP